MLRVGVPLPSPSAESLIVAAAKLYTFELFELVAVAALERRDFDPVVDDSECCFDEYSLVHDSDDAVYFVGVIRMTTDVFNSHRQSMGAWGSALTIVSACADALVTRDDLDVADLDEFADSLGVSLRDDTCARLRSLIQKHVPRPATKAVSKPTNNVSKRRRDEEEESEDLKV